jgi:hypothetical protein
MVNAQPRVTNRFIMIGSNMGPGRLKTLRHLLSKGLNRISSLELPDHA